MSLVLRKASQSDAGPIAEVLLSSRKAFLPFAPSPHTDDETYAWVNDVLLRSESVTVAAREGAVVGVLATKQDEAFSWITQFYLCPSDVGMGIGSKILDHARANLPHPIRLYTFQQNAGARRFFERNGFVPIEFTNGSMNEEHCPDVLYELASSSRGRA